jgi:hypothetical protein
VAKLSVQDIISLSVVSKSTKQNVAIAVHAHLHNLRVAFPASNVLVLYSPASVESEHVDTFTLRPTGSSSNVPGVLISSVVVSPATRVVYAFIKFAGIDHKLPSLFTSVEVPLEQWDHHHVKILEPELDFEVVTRRTDTPQEHNIIVYWHFVRRSANTFSIDKIVVHCNVFKLLGALAPLRASKLCRYCADIVYPSRIVHFTHLKMGKRILENCVSYTFENG